jgi:hypothetical protein
MLLSEGIVRSQAGTNRFASQKGVFKGARARMCVHGG